MAICVTKKTTELGPQFVLTPERYHPNRRMSLSPQDNGVLLSELVTLENETITAKRETAAWYQINTADAVSGYLNISDHPERLNSNKKILQTGDVIISRLRPYLRQVAYVDTDRDRKLCASTEFYVLRARNQESIAFLVPFLLSEAAQNVFLSSVEGSQHPRFKEEDLLHLVIPGELFARREAVSQRVIQAIHRYREYECALRGEICRVNALMVS